MCGIFAYLGAAYDESTLARAADTIAHRGPDGTVHTRVAPTVFFGFHRLALVGLDSASNQPLLHDDCTLICNGMIYNYRALIDQYSLAPTTANDCEVILLLYRRVGIWQTLRALDGVFAFALYDARLQQLIVANDPLGIRPLFMASFPGRRDSFAVASEPKALLALDPNAVVEHYPPGHRSFITAHECDTMAWWNPMRILALTSYSPQTTSARVLELLEAAVAKRLLGERHIACLLSGGLDSSTVAALVARRVPHVDTYSIGLENAPDLLAARAVATFIGSTHHEVIVTEAQMIAALPDVVRAIQSYDVTTVRASTPMFLLCRYIRETSKNVIIFNGDVSDELFGGYDYCAQAPSLEAFFIENWRLIDEIHRFDVLRSDRCIAHFGLDARTPFADRALVEYVMGIDPRAKQANAQQIAKHLLRAAVDTQALLPAEITWRPKVAFSDGVSSTARSWYEIVREHCAAAATENTDDNEELPPGLARTAEARYYRRIFTDAYGARACSLIPHYWMPRFVTGASDPSARTWKHLADNAGSDSVARSSGTM